MEMNSTLHMVTEVRSVKLILHIYSHNPRSTQTPCPSLLSLISSALTAMLPALYTVFQFSSRTTSPQWT